MSNSALVSFKIPPEHYAVLKAMADSRDQSLSEFVRDTLQEALDLDHKARLLATYFSESASRHLQPA